MAPWLGPMHSISKPISPILSIILAMGLPNGMRMLA